MRTTICELPHDPESLRRAWAALCAHTRAQRSEVVVLPELAFVEPVWAREDPDPRVWDAVVAESDSWIARLDELEVAHVIGARPITRGGLWLDEGFRWSARGGYEPLRRKRYMPSEPGAWEAEWFARGTEDFGVYEAGALRFGLNICTELWALETYDHYARASASMVVAPRATAAATIDKWLAIGTVGAVRAGAYSVSSNRCIPMDRAEAWAGSSTPTAGSSRSRPRLHRSRRSTSTSMHPYAPPRPIPATRSAPESSAAREMGTVLHCPKPAIALFSLASRAQLPRAEPRSSRTPTISWVSANSNYGGPSPFSRGVVPFLAACNPRLFAALRAAAGRGHAR